VIISFQVIEHIDPSQTIAFLKEIKRVLKPCGKLLLTTPNKKIRLLPFQKPWNKYHKKEYSAKELRKILRQVFPNVLIMGLRGKEEIEKIELSRVRQSPWEVYIKRPLFQLLKWTLPKQAIGFLKACKGSTYSIKRSELNENHDAKVFSFSLEDFYLDTSHLDKSLDLVAICEN